MVAVVGGTIISLIFGYLFAYWRELMNKQAHALKTDDQWAAGFDRMTSGKEGELAGAVRRNQAKAAPSAESTTKSRVRSSASSALSQHPEMIRLLELSQDFYPEIHQYLNNLGELGDELGKREVSEFKSFGAVSGSFLMERLYELLEMRFFERFLCPEGDAKMLRASWLSYSTAYLFCEDARLGSSTLSAYLEKKHHLAPHDVYRGVEYATLLSKGASRLALQESYRKKSEQSFERSLWLQDQTREQRIQLVWGLAHEKSYHALGIEGVVLLFERAALELEKVLQQAYKQYNQESSKKKAQQKKKTSSSSLPYEKEFDLLEMAPTEDIVEIKKQYKKMAMKYHPDRQDEHSSHERFVAIQRAYQILDKAYAKKAA